jgi:hypothetical protein
MEMNSDLNTNSGICVGAKWKIQQLKNRGENRN